MLLQQGINWIRKIFKWPVHTVNNYKINLNNNI